MKLKLLTLFICLLTLIGFSQNVPNPERYIFPFSLQNGYIPGSYGYKFSTNWYYAYRPDLIHANGNFFENEKVTNSLTNGLVLWLPIPADYNGSTYNFIRDSGGYHDFRLTPTSAWQNGSLYFPGTNIVCSETGSVFNIIGTQITISVWARMTAIPINPAVGALVNKDMTLPTQGYSDPFEAFYIGITDNSRTTFIISTGVSGSQRVLIGNQIIPLYYWKFLVGTYNGSVMLVYVDGVLDTSQLAVNNYTIASNSVPLLIGSWSHSSIYDSYFTGYIDDVKIWNRALTSNEQYQMYIDTRSKYTIPIGGQVVNYTENGTNFRAHIFYTNENLYVAENVTADVMVVAGGGAGGYSTAGNSYAGAGGGAGGYLYRTGFAITAGTYAVTIGSGGVATASSQTSGSNSIFSTLVATGGGYGANGSLVAVNGGNGGSGGGSTYLGAFGIGNQGSNGGTNINNTGASPGGGGYSGIGGGTPAAPLGGGIGGAGISNSISGSLTYYAGGGGGGGYYSTTPPGGIGGIGGGGAGGNGSRTAGGVGYPNTGGGGGGAGSQIAEGPTSGGGGGSGIVIIRYRVP